MQILRYLDPTKPVPNLFTILKNPKVLGDIRTSFGNLKEEIKSSFKIMVREQQSSPVVNKIKEKIPTSVHLAWKTGNYLWKKFINN